MRSGVARNPLSIRALYAAGRDFNRALRSLRGCRGFLLGGESFSLWSLTGGALVLIGVWLIFRKAKPAELEECETAVAQG